MSRSNASDFFPPLGSSGGAPEPRRAPFPWRRVARLAIVGVWLEFAAILVLSLVPGSERPHSGLGSGQLEHALAYGVAGATIALAYRGGRARFLALLPFAVGSGVFELLQTLVPDRGPQIIDALASVGGLLTGATIGAAATTLFGAVRTRRS